MKKTSQILITMVLLLLCNTIYAQTHTITLSVNTAELTNENVSSNSISQFYVSENTQVDVQSPPEAFTITVEDGSTVVWQGESSSSDEDTVDIFMIKWERGPKIFGPNDLEGNGRVQGEVNGNTPNELFKYKILFKVNGEGRMYQIDPKIKVGPGS